jgi:hypothetical protein
MLVDTQDNNTQHSNTQHNDIQHNYIQHNDTQHIDIQHNNTKTDAHLNITQHNNIQHNNKNQHFCALRCAVIFMLNVIMLNVVASSLACIYYLGSSFC